jgi:hypothetical protein
VATLTDLVPASTQVVQLSSASGDLIRCDVSVNGAYSSLQWRGPNDDTGSLTSFVTTVGAPRQGGTPYDISLTVNWDGNPVMAHVSVLPDLQEPVVNITSLPACIILPPVGMSLPPTLSCGLPGVPSVGTSSITVVY